MSKRIDDLQLLIERQEKCRAKHLSSTVVHERFEGMRVWDGVVETFELDNHPTAKRAYAWASSEIGEAIQILDFFALESQPSSKIKELSSRFACGKARSPRDNRRPTKLKLGHCR